MVVFPNAKINLGLNIVSKREDGYHNIETVFYPIPLTDVLEIELSSTNNEFIFSGIELESKLLDNICYKAYMDFKRYFNLPKIKCMLHKAIPIGAGLGGGSSDGAYIIKLLNDFFKLELSEKIMEKHTSKLGADCAFFIKNKPVLAKGIGNIFEPINLSLAGKFLVIVKPPVNISTQQAYDNIDLKQTKNSISKIIQQPIESWKDKLNNDFEKSIFSKYPQIAEIKEELYHHGAIYASMSGSGSAVYGIFDSSIYLKKNFPKDFFYWSDELE